MLAGFRYGELVAHVRDLDGGHTLTADNGREFRAAPAASGAVVCDSCGATHEATYSHEGSYGEGAIYAVVCPADYLTDYYRAERVTA